MPALAAPAEPIADTLTGGTFSYTVQTGDTLASISARFGVGVGVLMRDNAVRREARLIPGSRMQIDNRHIVARATDDRIVVNIPQRMLFSYSDGALAAAYPVALGRPDWPTPAGYFTVLTLQENKPWFVPKSIQEEMWREGKSVRTMVPPGPDNPLGKHWIGISIAGYGIHGTIAPMSIYGFRSHGCIRLHPDDVADLFARLNVGDTGRLIYEPVMLARLADGRIFLEVHRDIYMKASDPLTQLRDRAAAAEIDVLIDWAKAATAIKEQSGVAREVGLR